MSKSKSVVKQASFLAIAGILVRIIGLLYRSPLTAMIGDEGNGYYSTAYNIYALVLLISSYSIPTAISKLISEKLALNQYNNAYKILKCTFIYILVVAGSAAIIVFILAPYIVMDNAVPALRVLCPTIFLSGLLGVFRGYFQAHQVTVYTSISQVLEQILNAAVSLGAAYLFIQPYISTGGSKLASAGATGSALGTGAGVLIALIYMVLVYLRKKDKLYEKVDEDETENSYIEIFKTILHIVTPIIVATCIYNLITTIDMYLYYFAVGLQNMSDAQAAATYGIYSGKYVPLQNVPVALASAMSAATIPAISSAWATRDHKTTIHQIQSSINTTMLILIPAAIGMAVLSYPIMGLLFPQQETLRTAANLLCYGSPAIIFYGLSTISNGILQGIGEVNIPLKNAAIALVCHIVIDFILLVFTPLGVYVLIIGNIIYPMQVSFMNQHDLKKLMGYKQEYKKTYILPLISAIIMGIIVYGVYQGLFYLTRMVFIPLMISIIVGVVVYFVIIMYMSSDHPEYLEDIPYINRIARKFKRS